MAVYGLISDIPQEHLKLKRNKEDRSTEICSSNIDKFQKNGYSKIKTGRSVCFCLEANKYGEKI